MMAPCRLCNDLKKKDIDHVRHAFEFVPREIMWSANHNCQRCSIILEGILRFFESDSAFDRYVRHIYAYCLGNEDDTLSLEVYLANDRPKLNLEFFYQKNPDNRDVVSKLAARAVGSVQKRPQTSKLPSDWNAIQIRSSISGHPISPGGLRWTNSALDTCLTEHKSCHVGSKTKLPRRTLTFQSDYNGDIHVKLQETKYQHGRYIALSYCWGSSQTCVTTLNQLSAFKKRIPWKLLPKTFQDSIQFCLSLGVKYLWVDALCIIQDDESDWQIESAKMATIYQNAFLTLAATSSSSCSGGCYPEKAATVVEYEIPVDLSLTAASSFPIRVRKKLNHWTVPPTQRSIQLHPLLSRGWAFQERILSPRVLHFCGEEMIWECKETTYCECGGLSAPFLPKDQFDQMIEPDVEEIPDDYAEPSDRQRFHVGVDNTKSSRNVQSKLQSRKKRKSTWRMYRGSFQTAKLLHKLALKSVAIFERISSTHTNDTMMSNTYFATSYGIIWHRLIEQYSFLKLTKPTDRLPALSGLAQRASLFSGTYLAGLWRANLLPDLMWRVDKLELDCIRSTEFNSPSWSWISVAQPVQYWQDLEKQIVYQKRHGETAIPSLVDACRGTLLVASVKLAGKNPFGGVVSGVLEVTGYQRRARLKYVYSREGVGRISTRELVPDKYELEIHTNSYYPDMLMSFYADYILREPGKYHVPDGALIHLLLVNPYVCLVLFNREDENTFERIGIVRQPNILPEDYGVDWVAGILPTTIRII